MKLHRLTTICCIALSASLASAQCLTPVWSTQFGTAATGLAGGTGGGTSLAVFDSDGPGPLPPELYVGGYFLTAGGIPSRGIAKWNGQTWASVGSGMNNAVQALGLFDADGPGPGLPVLVAAGQFTIAGGVPAMHIAAWNGSQWSAIGTGVADLSDPQAVVEFDSDGAGPALPHLLIAAAYAGPEGEGIAQWDGASWSVFPGSVSNLKALAVFDEDGAGPANPCLFAGGHDPTGVRRWNGSQWDIPGGGLTRSANFQCGALRVVDEDGPGPGRPVLLAGGWFNFAGGIPARSIARWDGVSWSAMGSGIGLGEALVRTITTVDYTSGTGAPTIFAYAHWTHDPSIADSSIMRWNPASSTWSQVGLTEYFISFFPTGLASYNDGGSAPSLYIASGFSTVNNIPSPGFARLYCEPCYANCDGSATSPKLTANDFQCFLNRFAAAEPYANCDHSTSLPNLTANDFQCYLNAYATGCP